MSEDNSKKQRTDLKKHTKVGTQLKPPFAKIENIQFSSWKDERMPDMLWAVLVIGNWERDAALEFFRYVAKYVQDHQSCYDVTMSGIGNLTKEDRMSFLRHIAAYKGATSLLRSLLLFPDLPAHDDWKGVLESPIPEDDWNSVAQGVLRTLDHQSQEATDCRWVKLLCQILGGKLKFPQALADKVRAVLNYPNAGDISEIRPFIRATEIAPFAKDGASDWPSAFWRTSHLNTICIPLSPIDKPNGAVSLKIDINEIERVRIELLKHFVATQDTTALDPKHYAVFSLGFYALRLIDEVTATNLFRGALSRLMLRTLVEILITIKYLTKENDADLWLKYCEYGDSQAKLTSLKLDETGSVPNFINEAVVREIANQNRWEEFITIELGHWDKTDLRKLSIDAGCKDVYDSYYTWTSAYAHGNLAAVRESALGMCGNPVHRLHHIPNVRTLPLPSSLPDAMAVMNEIFSVIEANYPDFSARIEAKKQESGSDEDVSS